jgi:hypothetical protein
MAQGRSTAPHRNAMHSVAQRSSAPHLTAPHRNVQHSAVEYSVALHLTAECNYSQQNAAQRSIMHHGAGPHLTAQQSIAPHSQRSLAHPTAQHSAALLCTAPHRTAAQMATKRSAS